MRLEPFLIPLFLGLSELVFMTAADMVWGRLEAVEICLLFGKGKKKGKMYE